MKTVIPLARQLPEAFSVCVGFFLISTQNGNILVNNLFCRGNRNVLLSAFFWKLLLMDLDCFYFYCFQQPFNKSFQWFVPQDTDFGCKEDNRKKTTLELFKNLR